MIPSIDGVLRKEDKRKISQMEEFPAHMSQREGTRKQHEHYWGTLIK